MAFITVRDADGNGQPLELPEGISLNLMELLKAYEYPVLGTCGGMAICGSCHVQVLNGAKKLQPASDQEMDTLDSLPASKSDSRLACQIKVSDDIDQLEIKLLGEG